MQKLFLGFDWLLFICALLLFGFGAATLASVSPNLLIVQVIFFAVGSIFCLGFSFLDLHLYQSFRHLIFVAAIILLLFTLFLGWESHGAVRWISIGTFRLQFSELLKPFLIIAFASFLVEKSKSKLHDFLFLVALIVIPAILIFKQPDFGSALIYFLGLSVMILFSGFNLIYTLSSVGLSVILIPLVWHFLADYQKRRVVTFLSPDFDPLGAGYNAIQSVITIGSGMFLGKGLGRGTQSHLFFLPEKHTDFIFASIGEELGFAGASIVLTLYFFLVWRIFTIALKANSRLETLILVGIGLFFLIQGGINIGMNLGILPVTGVPLPLVSYGGSSMLSSMIALGIVENVAKKPNDPS